MHNLTRGRIRSAGLILTLCIFFLSYCGDSETQVNQGLTVSNLCFVTNGGDVSNTLLANSDWRIEITGDNPWIRVNRSSGSASSTPINLVFTALVNNNPDSRSQQIIIYIGSNPIRYIASQDGTENQVCFD